MIGKIVGKRSVGSYHYSKRLKEHQDLLYRVKVFLLSVEYQVDNWPEREQRKRCWVAPIKAAQMVEEGGLAEIIRGAFPHIRRLEAPWLDGPGSTEVLGSAVRPVVGARGAPSRPCTSH